MKLEERAMTMHERDESEFKRQFTASYLGAWAARRSEWSLLDVANSLPFEATNALAHAAWNRWVEINGVDRSIPEPAIHCCRDMDADMLGDNLQEIDDE